MTDDNWKKRIGTWRNFAIDFIQFWYTAQNGLPTPYVWYNIDSLPSTQPYFSICVFFARAGWTYFVNCRDLFFIFRHSINFISSQGSCKALWLIPAPPIFRAWIMTQRGYGFNFYHADVGIQHGPTHWLDNRTDRSQEPIYMNLNGDWIANISDLRSSVMCETSHCLTNGSHSYSGQVPYEI